MLALQNETPFQAERAVLLDGDGGQVWVVVVKATYRVTSAGRVELCPAQEPVCLSPVYADKPGESSLLRENEMVVAHPGTDVTVHAIARAPGEREVTELSAGVIVGDLRRSLRIFGDRQWKSTGVGLRKTKPQPFTRMPVTYERAFGGATAEAMYPFNPIGRGFAARPEELADTVLPNVEDPERLIEAWSDRPLPAGIGPIPPLWEPRRSHAGTYDEAWRRTRMPLWPEDLDVRFFRSAPPGMTSERHMRGGEEVQLLNLSVEPLLTIRLPRVEVVVHTWIASERVRQRVTLDRIILETEPMKVVLVWRSALRCGSSARKIRKSVVDTKEVVR